ncbi:two-component system, response regulator YesN [Paenibacillus sp. yr247]|uniref:response regulator n=1 Tax=Paenibacillus sp. yr247 TaxID=1761880 RepID=UPI00087EAFCB|nr:response regulator [Paenibacillus sp. yr247]SDO78191.1 two-component system, response regulator YesN [Paenibacillus sp. yr247]
MLNVLIIDDEPWSREVVKRLGEWERLQLFVVGEAEDGTEGLKQIEELKADIVVTDMRMPGIEGVELLKEMNKQFPTLKIIVMSGYDDFVYLKQAIHSRAVDYLLKPIDPDELNASLEKCVSELVEARTSENGTWNIPLIFTDSGFLDLYLGYRRQIYGYLLELNESAIFHTLEKLENFLEKAIQNMPVRNMLIKVGHDYTRMLEEFISENEVGFDHIWNKKNEEWSLQNWHSIPQATEGIGHIYMDAINTIKALRKNKNRLDLTEVQAYIERHYQDQISLDTIAHHFFVSKEHLSRSFKSFTGENISDTIIRRRMEKARELIVEHQLAIKNVAEITGYSDIAYFYRVFKKHYGLTPGELRNEE